MWYVQKGSKVEQRAAADKHPSVWKKAAYFYCAPLVTFWVNIGFYLLFLGLLSFTELVHLGGPTGWLERILIVWALAFLLEESEEVCSSCCTVV